MIVASDPMRVVTLLFLGAVALLIAGCAEDISASDPNRVSTLPWSRPERWEGQGALGGMMPQGR
jgi:hypothetical protein